MRHQLPNRRLSEQFKIETASQRLICTIGFDVTAGKMVEIFFTDRSKTGSGLDSMLYDTGVLLSMALQYGAKPKDLLSSLSADSLTFLALQKAIDIHGEYFGTGLPNASAHNAL